MFKKAFKTSSNNNISGKDKKKLIAELSKYYDAECLSSLLGKNTEVITLNKVQGSKMQLYIAGDTPILFDVSGKGDIYPTLYTILLYPNLVPFLEVNTGVESFIFGGANLMWPGVKNRANLGKFYKDDVRYIKASNGIPIAVGTMACTSEELAASGPTGTAMFVLHFLEDKLWLSGPKLLLEPAINEKAQNEEEKIPETNNEKNGEEEAEIEEPNQEKDNVESEEEKEENSAPADEEQKVSAEVMDEHLMEAFLTALKINLDEKDLPMDGGEFYTNNLLPCKRDGVYIDIKNTSYKKLGKFLQAMSKLGIIDFKEVKKGATPQITRVNKKHAKLVNFEPVVSEPAKKEEKVIEVADEDRWPKVEIKDYFKVKPQLFQLFPDDAYINEKEKLFSVQEVQNTILNYAKQHNLVDKRFIRLDDKMKALFDKQNVGKESFMAKDDLFKKLPEYLLPYHKITDLQSGDEETKGGGFKGINLVAEKSHNKNITRMVGLEPFKFNINSLVNKFQLKFACSVSTSVHKEKTAEKTEVVVHGNFLDKIITYLTEECHIPRKYITSVDKLAKKKK